MNRRHLRHTSDLADLVQGLAHCVYPGRKPARNFWAELAESTQVPTCTDNYGFPHERTAQQNYDVLLLLQAHLEEMVEEAGALLPREGEE